MSTNSTATVRVGPGLPTLLTVLFIALKLTGVIAWSWVWVLAPLWVAAGIGVLTLLVVLVFTLVAAAVVTRK